MSIFAKKKTLALTLFLFTDEDHPSPGESGAARNQYAADIIPDIIRKHYAQALRPPVKWNYFFHFNEGSSDEYRGQSGRYDFRHPKTNAIVNQKFFLDLCDELRYTWWECLGRQNPKYNKQTLKAAMEATQYDYFPERGLVVLSALLPAYIKQGSEDYKDTKTTQRK